MRFNPSIWRPIAIGLSGLNLVAVGFAAGAAEPWHAGIHAALGLVFGLWAQRLGRAPGGSDLRGSDLQSGLEALEIEVGNLRRELTETQERLDFTERMLAQGSETRRAGPER
jgi:hypothetical protein